MRLVMELDSRDFSRGISSRILHKLKGVEPGGPPHFVGPLFSGANATELYTL